MLGNKGRQAAGDSTAIAETHTHREIKICEMMHTVNSASRSRFGAPSIVFLGGSLARESGGFG